VHVNIPVFSNDRDMMRRAAATADATMEKVKELGGVVSGEHGIGLTKLHHLERSERDSLAAYRGEVDPDGVMNPGKLSDPGIVDLVFTPSFNLLELEARILQHGSLEKLADMISKCVRCGKCKPNCCVFYPKRGMFYHPRNKNLAVAALIEALLYEVQRFHNTEFRSLKHLGEVADQCTLCHKCLAPCPVSIDTGKVSVLEREILAARGFKRTAPPQGSAWAISPAGRGSTTRCSGRASWSWGLGANGWPIRSLGSSRSPRPGAGRCPWP
jgi:ferredoxin